MPINGNSLQWMATDETDNELELFTCYIVVLANTSNLRVAIPFVYNIDNWRLLRVDPIEIRFYVNDGSIRCR